MFMYLFCEKRLKIYRFVIKKSSPVCGTLAAYPLNQSNHNFRHGDLKVCARDYYD